MLIMKNKIKQKKITIIMHVTYIRKHKGICIDFLNLFLFPLPFVWQEYSKCSVLCLLVKVFIEEKYLSKFRSHFVFET